MNAFTSYSFNLLYTADRYHRRHRHHRHHRHHRRHRFSRRRFGRRPRAPGSPPSAPICQPKTNSKKGFFFLLSQDFLSCSFSWALRFTHHFFPFSPCALWFRTTKNPDVSSGSFACQFAHSLKPLTHLLAPHCSLCSLHTAHFVRSALLTLLAPHCSLCSLRTAHFARTLCSTHFFACLTYSWDCGKVDD